MLEPPLGEKKRGLMQSAKRKDYSRGFRTYSLCVFCLALLSVTTSAATPKVSNVAGGYVGDGKPATQAALADPFSVAIDPAGNIYIGDSFNCRIRKINLKGVIRTFCRYRYLWLWG